MTMIPGKDGLTIDNIDLTHAKDIICEKCGGMGFRQTMMLKKLSPLIIPKGAHIINNNGSFNDTVKHISKLLNKI